jgi:crossover junction endodeoxyribonuclease RuvC
MPTDAGVGLLLGIDPGLAATGWGLIDRDHCVVGCGTFRTLPGPPAPRLLRIVRELQNVLASHAVTEAALEELFMGRNATSAIGVAQARGAILAALAGADIPVHEYTPARIKATLTGYGGAGKGQMARMLSLQGIRPKEMDEHAADAVAVAICHARSRRLNQVGREV